MLIVGSTQTHTHTQHPIRKKNQRKYIKKVSDERLSESSYVECLDRWMSDSFEIKLNGKLWRLCSYNKPIKKYLLSFRHFFVRIRLYFSVIWWYNEWLYIYCFLMPFLKFIYLYFFAHRQRLFFLCCLPAMPNWISESHTKH